MSKGFGLFLRTLYDRRTKISGALEITLDVALFNKKPVRLQVLLIRRVKSDSLELKQSIKPQIRPVNNPLAYSRNL